MTEERRQYPRIATDVQVKFCKESVGAAMREYLSGIAENCSLGGMYIAARRAFPEGTILMLEFTVKSPEAGYDVVRARGVVRWMGHFGESKGMGLEFVEFHGLGKQTFEAWTEVLFDEQ
jgi:hypothetical protein